MRISVVQWALAAALLACAASPVNADGSVRIFLAVFYLASATVALASSSYYVLDAASGTTIRQEKTCLSHMIAVLLFLLSLI